MSQYWTMTPEEALKFLGARDAGESPELTGFQKPAGSGAFIDQRQFVTLRKELTALKKRFPVKLRQRDVEGGRFEQEACEIVHRQIGALEPRILADMDFWTWLAVGMMADIVEWRFGVTSGQARPENYGIVKRSENLLFRLWLRGEIGRDDTRKDPYELAKYGDQDLWRSHILRQSYANVRLIARMLLQLQEGKLRRKKLGTDEVRELAKRIRRLHANIVFEFLSASDTEAVVLELSSDLPT